QRTAPSRTPGGLRANGTDQTARQFCPRPRSLHVIFEGRRACRLTDRPPPRDARQFAAFHTEPGNVRKTRDCVVEPAGFEPSTWPRSAPGIAPRTERYCRSTGALSPRSCRIAFQNRMEDLNGKASIKAVQAFKKVR